MGSAIAPWRASRSGAEISPRVAAGTSAPGAAARAGGPSISIGRFKLEVTLIILLIGTFAAVEYQDLFTSNRLSFEPERATRYDAYWYDDSGNGGNSTISQTPAEPLKWSCELRPAYAYPFCGYGLLFDRGNRGIGEDFSRFQHVRIRLRFSGPGDTARLILKQYDPRYSKGPAGTKPNEVQFPIRQGEQTVDVDLDGLSVAQWWGDQNHIPKPLIAPQRDNVTALEMQPGGNSRPGHYSFAVESIDFEGKAMSQAQYYLGLLVLWAVFLSAFLVLRVLGIRRLFESRHERQLRESAELQFARAVAERTSAAKSAFLANMSHELRTPLNAILGYAQLLEKEGLDERQAQAARTIRQSGNHLLTLITDILDLSKIEAGRLELDPAPFDLGACVTGVAEMMRIRAAEKGIDLVCAIDRDVPVRIVGDEKRLRQVLINLLGNAIKFTQHGQVALRLSASAARDGASRLRFEVSDTGVGMRQDQLGRIFEAFEQVGDAGARSGGTGLGLSISRRIVALMGGDIHVESTEGRGSRFWFELAVEKADDWQPELAESEAAPALAAPAAAVAEFVPPPAEQLRALLKLAKTGNMRAIRSFAEGLSEEDERYRPFADRLKSLAAAYQSPAILELVSRHTDDREAA